MHTHLAFCVAAVHSTRHKLGLRDKYEAVTEPDGTLELTKTIDEEDAPRSFKFYLDIGLKRTSAGSRVFSAVKGASDGAMVAYSCHYLRGLRVGPHIQAHRQIDGWESESVKHKLEAKRLTHAPHRQVRRLLDLRYFFPFIYLRVRVYDYAHTTTAGGYLRLKLFICTYS